MNTEIQQTIDQLKQIGVDEYETLVLTETNDGVQISNVKTTFASQLDLEKLNCIKI